MKEEISLSRRIVNCTKSIHSLGYKTKKIPYTENLRCIIHQHQSSHHVSNILTKPLGVLDSVMILKLSTFSGCLYWKSLTSVRWALRTVACIFHLHTYLKPSSYSWSMVLHKLRKTTRIWPSYLICFLFRLHIIYFLRKVLPCQNNRLE